MNRYTNYESHTEWGKTNKPIESTIGKRKYTN